MQAKLRAPPAAVLTVLENWTRKTSTSPKNTILTAFFYPTPPTQTWSPPTLSPIVIIHPETVLPRFRNRQSASFRIQTQQHDTTPCSKPHRLPSSNSRSGPTPTTSPEPAFKTMTRLPPIHRSSFLTTKAGPSLNHSPTTQIRPVRRTRSPT